MQVEKLGYKDTIIVIPLYNHNSTFSNIISKNRYDKVLVKIKKPFLM